MNNGDVFPTSYEDHMKKSDVERYRRKLLELRSRFAVIV